MQCHNYCNQFIVLRPPDNLSSLEYPFSIANSATFLPITIFKISQTLQSAILKLIANNVIVFQFSCQNYISVLVNEYIIIRIIVSICHSNTRDASGYMCNVSQDVLMYTYNP